MTDEELIEAALAVRERAYSVYSGYSVGAALLDDSGHVHTGCNVENASYPQGSCAETGAIAAMVASGSRKIVAIALAGGREEPGNCTPCGGCRQRISEFAGPDTRILVESGGNWQTYSIDDLLPASFHLD